MNIALSRPTKKGGIKRGGRLMTAEERAQRMRTYSANSEKLQRFLKDEPKSMRMVPPLFAGLPGVSTELIQIEEYSDPVVLGFEWYVHNANRLYSTNFDPRVELDIFFERCRAKFSLPANGHVSRAGGDAGNDLHRSARLFLKEFKISNPKLTDRTALGAARRFLEPLVRIEFSKLKKERKKKITTKPQRVRMLALWNEQIARQRGISVEDAATATESTRVQAQHWQRIIRTEFPQAGKELIEAARTEVYAERRDTVSPKTKKPVRAKSKKHKR